MYHDFWKHPSVIFILGELMQDFFFPKTLAISLNPSYRTMDQNQVRDSCCVKRMDFFRHFLSGKVSPTTTMMIQSVPMEPSKALSGHPALMNECTSEVT